ncbi:MAG: V-type ATP synthase subunit D [Candidatus Omnitrophica bacterium]|nr:V-type ATP synthase subunit D [Candidatus Omnitrophota bacterium]
MPQIQYNKTFLMQINKDLGIRQNALPVLQSKEAALRAETRRMRSQVKEIAKNIEAKIQSLKPVQRLWSEFPDIIRIKKVNLKTKKIASIKVGIVENIEYDIDSFELFAQPAWFIQGVESIKEVFGLKIELLNLEKVLESVEYARRKTTQKVNLYEKVQIPFFEEATRKIKRFLEDEENLSKSSQKVIKKRIEEESGV